MKRLLCIVNTLDAGGAETFLMKMYRCIDTSKYQMDFCVMNTGKGIYEDEILSRGGIVFHTERKSRNPIRCFLDIRRIVRENAYEYVLRVNEKSLAVIDLIAAKLGGARILAMRSSNAANIGKVTNILQKVFSRLPKRIPDVKFAPSTEAAEYTFGKGCVERGEAQLLYNGLDLDTYRFDPDAREVLRREYGLDGKIVIGHVGRFSKQKNHIFLIDVFAELCRVNSDVALVLVGKGELEEEIRTKVKSLGLEDKVIFLGLRKDVPAVLSAFDVLLFPSFHEGMPNVVIEAQCTGLPCVISDTITREADITGLVRYVPLDGTLRVWADECLNSYDAGKRKDTMEDFITAGYDLNSVADNFIHLIFEEEAN